MQKVIVQVCLHSKDIVVVQDIRLADYHVQTYYIPFESKSANMSCYGFKLVSSAHTTPYIKFPFTSLYIPFSQFYRCCQSVMLSSSRPNYLDVQWDSQRGEFGCER